MQIKSATPTFTNNGKVDAITCREKIRETFMSIHVHLFPLLMTRQINVFLPGGFLLTSSAGGGLEGTGGPIPW